MVWFALLLVGAVISGNEANQTPLATTALQHDVLAKGMLLQTSSLYLQRMYVKGTNDKGEEVVEGINKVPPADDTEVISAIFSKYVQFRLVINFLACVAFYKAGAAAPEAGEAEGCDEYSKYIHWFKKQFKPTELYGHLKNPGRTDAKYNLKQVVEHLEVLYERQEVMFQAFEISGANQQTPYVDVFQVLRMTTADGKPHPNLSEDDAKPLVKAAVQRGEVEDKFRVDTLKLLYQYYGEELLFVESYWNLFFSPAAERPLVTDAKQMVREALVEEDAQRGHFKAMEESNLDATILDFQNAHEVEYVGLLYYGLEMRVRNIGEVLPIRDWKILPTKPGSPVDFEFRFDQPPPPVEAAGTSSGGGAAGGSGGDSGMQASAGYGVGSSSTMEMV